MHFLFFVFFLFLFLLHTLHTVYPGQTAPTSLPGTSSTFSHYTILLPWVTVTHVGEMEKDFGSLKEMNQSRVLEEAGRVDALAKPQLISRSLLGQVGERRGVKEKVS